MTYLFLAIDFQVDQHVSLVIFCLVSGKHVRTEMWFWLPFAVYFFFHPSRKRTDDDIVPRRIISDIMLMSSKILPKHRLQRTEKRK